MSALQRTLSLSAICLGLLACSPVARDLGNLACDNGACVGGYSCDTDANVCVTTGEACSDEGRTSACPSDMVRECTGGVWSDCTPYGGQCTPGSKECNTGALIECDGRGYVAQSTPCGAPGCNDMVAPQRCNACAPNTTSCDGLVFVTCSPEGLVASQENCDTGSACAGAGTCDPALGCDVVNQAPDGSPCDEGVGLNGNRCDSSCQSGVCALVPPNCGDSYECTTDSCDNLAGCMFVSKVVGAPCNGGDGDFCDSSCDGGTICRNAVPVSCDDSAACTSDTCNPVSGACSNTIVGNGVLCRSAAGPCDAAETCDGSSPACPPDLLLGNTVVCGPATGACDAARCTGTGVTCPNSGFSPAGTACGDATNSTCTDPDDCDGSGACQPHHAGDGTACNDCSAGPGNCTTCLAGTCRNQFSCSAGQYFCDATDPRLRHLCNSAGDGIDSSAQCDFICSPNSNNCASVSSGLDATMRNCDAADPPLAPPSGTLTLTSAGITCSAGCGTVSSIASTMVGGLDVVCVSRVDIPSGVTMTADATATRPMVLLVAGAAALFGSIDFSGATNSCSAGACSGGPAGPGGFRGGIRCSGNGCDGAAGLGSGGGEGGQGRLSGSAGKGGGGGGGGYAGSGGIGGYGENDTNVAGGTGGATYGVATLVPLEGGSGGGAGGDGSGGATGGTGGGGGGAVQISARDNLVVSGALVSNGGAGANDAEGGAGGGGSGGAFLIEARTIDLTGASIQVNGGAGGTGGTAGGAGASGSNIDGAPGTDSTLTSQSGGGGGGGGGRVRVNAVSGAACPAATSPAGACSTGTL